MPRFYFTCIFLKSEVVIHYFTTWQKSSTSFSQSFGERLAHYWQNWYNRGLQAATRGTFFTTLSRFCDNKALTLLSLSHFKINLAPTYDQASSLFPLSVLLVIMTKDFSFSFIRPQDLSPKMKVFHFCLQTPTEPLMLLLELSLWRFIFFGV